MTEQLSLRLYIPYGGAAPAQSHSPTSLKAAAEIQPKIGPLHRIIMECLAGCPDGLTDEQMQSILNMPANTQRPRRRELQLYGRVKDSGRTRLTRSGRSAVVWTLGHEGVENDRVPCGQERL